MTRWLFPLVFATIAWVGIAIGSIFVTTFGALALGFVGGARTVFGRTRHSPMCADCKRRALRYAEAFGWADPARGEPVGSGAPVVGTISDAELATLARADPRTVCARVGHLPGLPSTICCRCGVDLAAATAKRDLDTPAGRG